MGKVNINRPVHLALRDRNYEESLRLLKYTFEGRPFASRKKIIYSLIDKLETAYNESRFALRGIIGSQRELDFIRFLKMDLDASLSVKFIVDHEGILERDTSFLKRFLRDNPETLKDFKIFHRRRAENILKGIKFMAGVTEKVFLELKRENFQQLSEDEQRRYTIMFQSSGLNHD